jgi:hypothetical protein
MRRLAAMLLACLAAGGAQAQSDADTLRRLEQCFALTRVADAICDKSLGIDAAKLDCLKKSRDAEKECLDRVHMGPSAAAPTGATPVAPAKPSAAAPTGATPVALAKPSAAAPAGATPVATAKPSVAAPTGATPVALAKPSAAAPTGATPVAPAKPSSSGWTVGETTSPVDFSPLLVAELRPVDPAPNGAPAALTLRCRSARTEISVLAQGTWRPSRAGDVDVALQMDGQETGHLRWLLSQDGRTASLPQDAAEIVRTWRESRVSIAVTDGGGSGGASIFDLSGFETVRARLSAACHWPPPRTEARSR